MNRALFPTLLLPPLAAFSLRLPRCLEAELRRDGRRPLLALAAITVLGTLFRLAFLDQPMRYDEAFTYIRYASKPLGIALADYSSPNNHLLHSFLVHIVSLCLGHDPWALRLPALVAGLLLVPTTYLVARLLYDAPAALLAGALVAASSPLIEYSTNARGYTLVVLLFLLSLVLATHLVHSGGVAGWLVLGALSALGFYTIPIMLYPCSIVVTWLLLAIVSHRSTVPRAVLIRNLCISVAVTLVLTTLLYVPVFLTSGVQSVIGNRFVTPLAWDQFLAGMPRFVGSVWRQWHRDLPPIVSIILVLGFVASLSPWRSARQRVPLILAIGLCLPPLILIQRRLGYERVWLFLLPIYFVFAAGGLSSLARWLTPVPATVRSVLRVGGAPAIAVWLGLAVIHSQSVYYSRETGIFLAAEKMAMLLRDDLRPGDAVVSSLEGGPPLEYYFRKYGIPREYLNTNASLPDEGGDGGRIILAVNERTDTLDGMLDRVNLRGGEYGRPRLVQAYGLETLYEVRRTTSGAQPLSLTLAFNAGSE